MDLFLTHPYESLMFQAGNDDPVMTISTDGMDSPSVFFDDLWGCFLN